MVIRSLVNFLYLIYGYPLFSSLEQVFEDKRTGNRKVNSRGVTTSIVIRNGEIIFHSLSVSCDCNKLAVTAKRREESKKSG